MFKRAFQIVFSLCIFIFCFYLLFFLAGITFDAVFHAKDFKSRFMKRPLVARILQDKEKAKRKAMAETLNYYLPSEEYLREVLKSPAQLDTGRLGESVKYYERVIQFMPDSADAFVLLGFCYYYSDNSASAIDAYQKALAINPQLFLPAYNLGIIFFKQGQFQKAANFFQYALRQDPKVNLEMMFRSRVYVPLTQGIDNAPVTAVNHFNSYYQNARALLTFSVKAVKEGKLSANFPPQSDALDIKVF